MNQAPFRTALFALALGLAACSQPSQSPPLEGARIGGPFALTGADGRTVRDTDFAGKYRIVYFGYTYCPDVCPVDMANIGQGVKLLAKSDPDAASRVVPIFISIDPARDTPEVVGKFAANFGDTVVGLTGTPEQIAAVAKSYAAIYSKEGDPKAKDYLMSHTNIAYLMGPDGKPIALLPAEQSGQAVADELGKWVK
ncbi:SCO family protein [Sphingomonas sp. BGYR3]|uniref:SCO family protein n=1 Tax=Sphingomonas sp. BGYR3 TaxID=2975483 RepID=UPI0021A804DF|nr:SCO family protein [Sphingomonas sp. BGYR3]MDG5488666.1 SCO family protein [Sphingomonas sp. BGYR3]